MAGDLVGTGIPFPKIFPLRRPVPDAVPGTRFFGRYVRTRRIARSARYLFEKKDSFDRLAGLSEGPRRLGDRIPETLRRGINSGPQPIVIGGRIEERGEIAGFAEAAIGDKPVAIVAQANAFLKVSRFLRQRHPAIFDVADSRGCPDPHSPGAIRREAGWCIIGKLSPALGTLWFAGFTPEQALRRARPDAAIAGLKAAVCRTPR